MLTLSETAATLLTQSRSQQGIPDDAVLRVAPAPGGAEAGGISIGFVDEPLAGDHTGDAHGMPLAVAPDVADALDSAKIDVDTTGDSAQLVLVPAHA